MEHTVDAPTAVQGVTAFPLAGSMRGVARVVSHIGSPPAVALAAICLVAYALGSSEAWKWTLVHGILAICLPLFYVLYLYRRGRITDLHLNVRAERVRPLVFAASTSVAAFVILVEGAAPHALVATAAIYALQLAIFLVITIRWKISMHCASAAGLAVLALVFLGRAAWPLVAIVPLMAWARLRLRRHTLAQTVAGTALGTVLWSLVPLL